MNETPSWLMNFHIKHALNMRQTCIVNRAPIEDARAAEVAAK